MQLVGYTICEIFKIKNNGKLCLLVWLATNVELREKEGDFGDLMNKCLRMG